MSHKKLQHLTTSKVLELLHMNLMGPMQVESIGGKRYAYVVVDNVLEERVTSDLPVLFLNLSPRISRRP